MTPVPPQPPNFVKAWSYSAFEKWLECPFRFRLEKLDKLPTADVPAFKKGREAHEGLAAYATGKPAPMPAAVKAQKAKEIADLVRAFPASNKVVEQQWAFDGEFKTTAWFGKTTWLRTVLDVGLFYEDGEVEVVDWKTGKPRDANAGEMEVFAMSVMARFPNRPGDVLTRLVYLESGREDADRFRRSDREKLMRKWRDAVAPMFADRTFPARPNEKCKWCDFSRSKGGQCRHDG